MWMTVFRGIATFSVLLVTIDAFGRAESEGGRMLAMICGSIAISAIWMH